MPRKGWKKPESPRDVTLDGGGKISLSMKDVDIFNLSPTDRAFVFQLIDLFAAYASRPDKEEEPKVPGIAVTLARVT